MNRVLLFVTFILTHFTSPLPGRGTASYFGHSRNKYWNGYRNFDLTQLRWAHEVNSRAALREALLSDVAFLEADVSLGKLLSSPDEGITVIMAHPPATSSDLSLDEFLDAVFSQTSKGIKLDFKVPQAVPIALEKIMERNFAVKIPIWLNGDILRGPVNAAEPLLNSKEFLQLCKRIPTAVISVGWTTRFGPDITNPFNIIKQGSYSWDDVQRMANVLQEGEVTQPVTFAVRAGIVASEESHINLLWLLDQIPYSTLTIWGSQYDTVNIKGLVTFISKAGKDRVYLDLPAGDDCQVRHFKGPSTLVG